jgi:hypothetical protein
LRLFRTRATPKPLITSPSGNCGTKEIVHARHPAAHTRIWRQLQCLQKQIAFGQVRQRSRLDMKIGLRDLGADCRFFQRDDAGFAIGHSNLLKQQTIYTFDDGPVTDIVEPITGIDGNFLAA